MAQDNLFSERFYNLHKLKSGLKVGLANLVVFFCLCELGSLTYFWWVTRHIYYTDRETVLREVMPITSKGLRLGTDAIVERLHPFFGYVQRPGEDFRPGFKYNNYGFISPYDYPFSTNGDDDIVVGVFGGSVASNYAIFEHQHNVLGQALQAVPAYRGKRIRILSFAIGGYKQPQQLMVFNYMLARGQKFDIVINIDGFNEVALSPLNKTYRLDYAMPSVAHVGPLTSIANNSLSPISLSALLAVKEKKEALSELMSFIYDCHTASCATVGALVNYWLLSHYERAIDQFASEKASSQQRESVMFFYSQGNELIHSTFYEEVVAHWRMSTRLMHQLALSNDILYFHFIQPNQYAKTDRVFSLDEAKRVIDDTSPYKEGVEQGYPLLIHASQELTATKVAVHSLVDIFDDISEPVYVDACCHLNVLGEHILSEKIAAHIVRTHR